jgi:hypothetical protein
VPEGERLDIIHAGGENVMWKVSSSTEDYHSQIILKVMKNDCRKN